MVLKPGSLKWSSCCLCSSHRFWCTFPLALVLHFAAFAQVTVRILSRWGNSPKVLETLWATTWYFRYVIWLLYILLPPLYLELASFFWKRKVKLQNIYFLDIGLTQKTYFATLCRLVLHFKNSWLHAKSFHRWDRRWWC